ncbi:MAG: hypothetical protein AB7H80_10155 [Candidatus Kapaibacterium sp.]
MRSIVDKSFVMLASTLFASALLLTSCTTDPTYSELGVDVRTFDLPPLDPSEGHYELWFSYPDDPVSGKPTAVQHGDALYVSFGKFVVDQDGTVRGLDGGSPSFTIPEGYNPSLLNDAILTIEAPNDSDDTPSGRFLSGNFAGTSEQGEAVLKTNGNDAFGNAFDTLNLSGVYRLISLSTTATNDDVQGIWFVDLIGRATLKLPDMPTSRDNPNWAYESWLVRTVGGTTEYISLGKFGQADTLDVDGAGPNAGSDPILLSAPGEDFVQGDIRLLNDGTYDVIVSLQPTGIVLNRPFYPLLQGPPIPKDLDPMETQPMTLAPGLPAIEITVDR